MSLKKILKPTKAKIFITSILFIITFLLVLMGGVSCLVDFFEPCEPAAIITFPTIFLTLPVYLPEKLMIDYNLLPKFRDSLIFFIISLIIILAYHYLIVSLILGYRKQKRQPAQGKKK